MIEILLVLVVLYIVANLAWWSILCLGVTFLGGGPPKKPASKPLPQERLAALEEAFEAIKKARGGQPTLDAMNRYDTLLKDIREQC